MRTSVVIALFNGASFLEEQIESILNQTMSVDEIVIADDGSSDGSVSICLELLAQDPSLTFKLLRGGRAPLGYVRNFERALQESTGDIIFLCDQDDIWCPSKVEHCLALLSESPSLVVIHDQLLVDAGGVTHGETMLGRFAACGVATSLHVKGSATALDRRILEYALPFPIGTTHDAFIHAIGRELGSRLVVSAVLMKYRLHGRNTSGFMLNQPGPLSFVDRSKAFVRGLLLIVTERIPVLRRYSAVGRVRAAAVARVRTVA